jgi:FixJ family two-component response regulator
MDRCSSLLVISALMSHKLQRISVVDDEDSVRKALGRLFFSAGFQVETFASAREFLDSLDKHAPDCVVLDLDLPDLSGEEVIQQVRRDKLKLPIVMITGSDKPGVAKRVLAEGAASYLLKPVDERDLLAAIAAATLPSLAEKDAAEPVRT